MRRFGEVFTVSAPSTSMGTHFGSHLYIRIQPCRIRDNAVDSQTQLVDRTNSWLTSADPSDD